MQAAFIVVCIYAIVREIIFYITFQKLVNKLMSRNFYEYNQSLDVNKPRTGKKVELKESEGPDELGILTDYAGVGD